jgi:hypothetical protein
MARDPLDYTPDDVRAPVGARVRARLLGWDGRYETGTERDIVRADLGTDTVVEGFLAVTHVPPFGDWNFTVAGRTVDPATIEPLSA